MTHFCVNHDFSELRNWLLLILGFIGGVITIRTFVNSQKQRRLDNTYKTLAFLRRHIGGEQIKTFIDLFHANSELSGVGYNEFRLGNGRTDTIETMFSEGGCGNGDIHNMIELFNLISPTLKDLDAQIIWYEYGQIMSTLYNWTKYLEDIKNNDDNFLIDETFYLNFNKYMKKKWESILTLPMKHYTYSEY